MAQEGVYIGNLKIPAFKGGKGDQGEAGKIVALSAEKLGSTATPTVENLGTESEAVLKFGIPQGVSVSQVSISNDELVITLDDGSIMNLGNVVGRGIVNAWLDEGQIFFEYSDGTTETAGYIYDDALIQSQLAEIESVKDNALDDIGTAKTNATGAVNDAKTSALGDISDAKAGALGDISDAKTSAISDMNDIKADVQQLKEDTEGIKGDVEDIQTEIGQDKDYIDGVVADFAESEEELQYILGVLGDIEAIIDDINGYDDANEEEY